jgi:hypothetical protein
MMGAAAQQAPREKIDCQVCEMKGGKQLVFTVAGKCVGELFISADAPYLPDIAQLFSYWVKTQRGGLTIASSIRGLVNGSRR